MKLRVAFTLISGNAKTGPIPVSVSARESCPITCPFYQKGCYAQYGPLGMHWRAVSAEQRGDNWDAFIRQVKKLPQGQLWRHNAAGDLPQTATGRIIGKMLDQLVSANRGKKGFTYTHHRLTDGNVKAIREANQNGFTINCSTESIEQADKIMSRYGIPAVAVVDSRYADKSEPGFLKTKSGRRVIVCPAARDERVSCATCGICQVADRQSIVAFPAHGAAAKTVSAIVGS